MESTADGGAVTASESDSEAETCSESETEDVAETVTTFIANDKTVAEKPAWSISDSSSQYCATRAGCTETLAISDTFLAGRPVLQTFHLGLHKG